MRSLLALAAALTCLALPVAAENVSFGDDTATFANDGECDDPRFYGPGATSDVDWASAGRDAADCKASLDEGTVTFWNPAEGLQPVICDAADFGEDLGEEAGNGLCDDPRFVSFGGFMNFEDAIGADASDCKRICELGILYTYPGME